MWFVATVLTFVQSVAATAPEKHSQAGYRPWVPVYLMEHPLAICNDGSPGAYYLRRGLPGSRRWVVYLEGMGWCWDVPSCARNWQRSHGTSHKFPRTAAQLDYRGRRFLSQGIFDPVKSPLADAHIAYVKACSNDAFMGDRSPTVPTHEPFVHRRPDTAWHFRGRRIVEAVFRDLRRRTGLGDLDGDRVVYGGGSAGARGALVTMDWIASMPSIVGKASVVGLLDSGFWIPISPHPKNVGWASFGQQMRSALNLMNASFLLGDACSEEYPGEQQWKCLMPAYRVKFVRTPYFIVHSQYDKFALTMNLWGHYSFAVPPPRLLPWADNYRQLVLRYLPEPTQNSGKVVFSPASYFHCVVTTPQFWTTVANQTLLSDALQQWLDNPYTSERISESCQGFDCGSHLGMPLQYRKLRKLRLRRLSITDPAPVELPLPIPQPPGMLAPPVLV